MKAKALEQEQDIEAVADGLTENAHAQRFAIAYDNELKYDHRRGIWLCCDKGRWRPDATRQVRRHAIEFTRLRQRTALREEEDKKRFLKFLLQAETKSAIDRMVNAAEGMLPIADQGINWDADPWLLGTPQAIIDLRTGQERPGDPSDRVTFAVATTFDATAECPKFEAFLNQVFNGNAELIEFLRRFVGYSLTGITTEQVLLMCYGKGANGKSTLLNVLRKVFGDYAHNLPFSSLEPQAKGAISNDMAALNGRRFVVASETNEGSKLNEGRIKALTGGDPITARFMHAEFFTFDPQAKFLLSVNHKPEVSDDTVSMWRRILLLPFTQTFTGSACDPNLPAALWSEAPGILNWAIKGCLDWQANGLGAPLIVHEATNNYQNEADTLGDFIDGNFELDAAESVKAGDIQGIYVKWTQRERIAKRDCLTAKKLASKLSERFQKRHTREGWWYDGLKISTGKLW